MREVHAVGIGGDLRRAGARHDLGDFGKLEQGLLDLERGFDRFAEADARRSRRLNDDAPSSSCGMNSLPMNGTKIRLKANTPAAMATVING